MSAEAEEPTGRPSDGDAIKGSDFPKPRSKNRSAWRRRSRQRIPDSRIGQRGPSDLAEGG
jgi:hypothetical protein